MYAFMTTGRIWTNLVPNPTSPLLLNLNWGTSDSMDTGNQRSKFWLSVRLGQPKKSLDNQKY